MYFIICNFGDPVLFTAQDAGRGRAEGTADVRDTEALAAPAFILYSCAGGRLRQPDDRSIGVSFGNTGNRYGDIKRVFMDQFRSDHHGPGHLLLSDGFIRKSAVDLFWNAHIVDQPFRTSAGRFQPAAADQPACCLLVRHRVFYMAYPVYFLQKIIFTERFR